MVAQTPQALRDEVRGELLKWAPVPYAVVGLGVALSDRQGAPPPSSAAFGLLVMALGVVVWVIRRHHTLAGWLLAVISVLLALLAQRWFPGTGAYQMIAYPIVASALILGPRAAALLSVAAIASLGATMVGSRPQYDATIMVVVSAITVGSILFLTSIANKLERTTVVWAWQGYTDARANLELARNRQVELKQALEDLA